VNLDPPLALSPADPGFSRVLEQQFRLERLRAVRILLLTLLAVVGAMVWADAVWPRAVHPRGGLAALLSWPLCFGGYILVRVLEAGTERRLHQLLQGGPRPSR